LLPEVEAVESSRAATVSRRERSDMAVRPVAPAVADEELQLKKRARRRLVGAVVLVLLVVVVLPWILEDEPRPIDPNVPIQIPPLDSAEDKFPTASAGSERPPAPAGNSGFAGSAPGPAAGEPAEQAPVEKPTSRNPASEKAPQSTAEAAPDAAERPEMPSGSVPPALTPGTARSGDTRVERKTAAGAVPAQEAASRAGKKYVVRVGAFADSGNARQVMDKLRAARIPAYTEPVQTAGGTSIRVRAGPYATQDAAEKARQKLVAMKLGGGDFKIVRQGE
jgi:DedD protein